MSATVDGEHESGGEIRRETLNGTEYLVAPVVAIREGVYMYPRQNGRGIRREFLPEEEIVASVNEWEDQPLTLNHPQDGEGRPGLTVDPSMEYSEIGLFRNVANKDDALVGETWIEVAEVGDHNGDLENYVNSIEAGSPQEVSTGYRAATDFERGTYENQRYTYIQRKPEPDHLALLTDNPGNCSVEEGCGAGAVLNKMPLANNDGVRVNNRRMTTNVTPEQIDIVQEIVDDFVDSQGNATLSELHTWIRENEDLDADDKTAIRAVLDDVFDMDPGEWRVEGEFTSWLDRRAEQSRENTLDDISEPAGILSVDEGSENESDTALNVLEDLREKMNRILGSSDEPNSDTESEHEEIESASGESGGESTSDSDEETMKDEERERLIKEVTTNSEIKEESLEGMGDTCLETTHESIVNSESGEESEEVEEESMKANEQIEEMEERIEDLHATINELQEEREEERSQREQHVNKLLEENSELGEETIEGMDLEDKENLVEDLGVDEDEDEEASAQFNMSGIPDDNIGHDFDADDTPDVPAGGRTNWESREESED